MSQIRNKTSSPLVNKSTSDANKRLSLIAEFIFQGNHKIVFISAHDDNSILLCIQLEGGGASLFVATKVKI